MTTPRPEDEKKQQQSRIGGAVSGQETNPPPTTPHAPRTRFPLIAILIGAAGLFLLVLVVAGGAVGVYFLFVRGPAAFRLHGHAKGDEKPKDEKEKVEPKSDPVTIKLKKRGDGESAVFEVAMTRMLFGKTTDKQGTVLREVNNDRSGFVFKYRETVLQRDEDGLLAKLERDYAKAQMTIGVGAIDLEVAKRTVVIDKQSGKFTFAFKDGADLPALFANAIAAEFDAKNPWLQDFESHIVPDEAVRVGDNWKPDAEAFVKQLDKDRFEFAPGAEARMVLTKTYQYEKRTYGCLQGNFEIPLKAMYKGKKNEIRFGKGAKLTIEFEMDVCIDGSAELGNTFIRETISGSGAPAQSPGGTEMVSSVLEITRVASGAAP